MPVLKSLAGLNDPDRSEAKKIVVKGRTKSSIQNLERAIKVLNEEYKEEKEKKDKQAKDSKERREARKKQSEEKKQKRSQEEAKEKERILKLREEADKQDKQQEQELKKMKEQIDKQEKKEVKELKEEAKKETKEVKEVKEVKKDTKGIYETLFGKSTVKKGEYIPSDDRLFKIEEGQLRRYKKLETQVKKDKLTIARNKQNITKQLSGILKKMEYKERVKQEIYDSQERRIKLLSDQFEKDSKEKMKYIKHKEDELNSIQASIKKQIHQLKHRKIRPEQKKRINKILKEYDGTPESIEDILQKINKLTKHKRNKRTKKRKKKSPKKTPKKSPKYTDIQITAN